ncbi:MAG: hypothetical protein ABI743_01550 [bacterium]
MIPATLRGAGAGAWVGLSLALVVGLLAGHSPLHLLRDFLSLVPVATGMGGGIGYCLSIPAAPLPPAPPTIRQPRPIAADAINRILSPKGERNAGG